MFDQRTSEISLGILQSPSKIILHYAAKQGNQAWWATVWSAEGTSNYFNATLLGAGQEPGGGVGVEEGGILH